LPTTLTARVHAWPSALDVDLEAARVPGRILAAKVKSELVDRTLLAREPRLRSNERARSDGEKPRCCRNVRACSVSAQARAVSRSDPSEKPYD
jgi:hypothetical protein